MTALPGMPHLGTYRLIAADPPWEHDNYGQAKHGAAKSAYDEMPLASLCEMPVGSLAHPEGALLFLWCTGVQAADGVHVELARAWGFRLTTRIFSWVKVARACDDERCGHPWSAHEAPAVVDDAPGPCTRACECTGFVVRARRGPGSYSMQGVEDVWLGVRGEGWNRDRERRDVPEILFEPIGKHSAKPERIYDRIEALWRAAPRLELFARRRRAGWAAWGKQAPDCDLVFGAEVGTTWPVRRSDASSPRETTRPLFEETEPVGPDSFGGTDEGSQYDVTPSAARLMRGDA